MTHPSVTEPTPPSHWKPRSSGSGVDSYLSTIAAILLCSLAITLSVAAAVWFFVRRCRPGARESDVEKRMRRERSEIARALPVVARGAEGEGDCAICLGELAGGGEGQEETVREIPGCGHRFHAACIERWFQTRSSCPTCRLSCHRRDEAPPDPAQAIEPNGPAGNLTT